MAVVIGCGMLILSMPIRWLGLLVVGPSEAVAPLADTYIGIRIWSAPATLVNFVAAGWLLGVQRADLVLALQVFINLLNVALDLLLGVVLGWGLGRRRMGDGDR